MGSSKILCWVILLAAILAECYYATHLKHVRMAENQPWAYYLRAACKLCVVLGAYQLLHFLALKHIHLTTAYIVWFVTGTIVIATFSHGHLEQISPKKAILMGIILILAVVLAIDDIRQEDST